MFSLKTLRAPFAFSCKPVLFFFSFTQTPHPFFYKFSHPNRCVHVCFLYYLRRWTRCVAFLPGNLQVQRSRLRRWPGHLLSHQHRPPSPYPNSGSANWPTWGSKMKWTWINLFVFTGRRAFKNKQKKKKHIKAETQWSGLYEVATVGWYVYSQLPSLLTFFIWLAGPITHQPHIHSACSVWHLSPCPPPGLWCNHPHIHSSSWQLRARLEAQGCGLIFMQQQLPVYPDGLHHKLCTAGPGLK